MFVPVFGISSPVIPVLIFSTPPVWSKTYPFSAVKVHECKPFVTVVSFGSTVQCDNSNVTVECGKVDVSCTV